ncbi:inositol-tetrakisphosphate 1-kinase [Tanacetum coccineum]
MMHPGRLHGHMRKKLLCVKVGLTYPKIACLVTQGRMLDFDTVHPAVVRFCGVYGNVTRRFHESGASDADYYARHLLTMQLKPEQHLNFVIWEILKDSPKWMQSEVLKFAAKSRGGSKRYKSSGSSSFNTESEEASINLNANVGDDEEDEVQKIRRPMGRDKAKDAAKKKGSRASGSSSMNDEALARLMVTEMASQEKEERLAFLEIKRREVECREREYADKLREKRKKAEITLRIMRLMHEIEEEEEEDNEIEIESSSGSIVELGMKGVVVGYALTSKKIKSFLQPKLEGLARNKGIYFVAIDQTRPLTDQGPFDIVLHKLSGKEWQQILEDYRLTHPEVTVLDPPGAIQHVYNRQSMLQDVADLDFSDAYERTSFAIEAMPELSAY